MKEKRFGKSVTLVSAIILIALVIASAVLSVIIKNANNTTVAENLSNVNAKEALFEPVSINEDFGNGTVTGEIYIEGQGQDQNVYNNGYCLNKGANLWGGDVLSHSADAYDTNNAKSGQSGKIRWLLDNFVRMNLSKNDVSTDEYNFYIQNLKNIIASQGYSNVDNILNDFNDDLNKELFIIQQYALWNYTNNTRAIDLSIDALFPANVGLNNNRRAIYDSLLKEAEKHANYTGNGQNNVTLDKGNCQMQQSGNDVLIGPIKVNNSVGKTFKFSYSGFANLGNKTVKAYKSDKTTEIPNNSFSNYNGDIYIKIFNANISTGTYTVTGNINTVTYKTSAYYWSNPNLQEVVTLSRTPTGDSVSVSVTHENLEGKYQVTVKKADFDNDSSVNLGNGSFKVELVKDVQNLSGNITGTRTSISGTKTDSLMKFSPINITNTGYDALIISENVAPDGYIRYEKQIILYVKKGVNQGKYIGDVVRDSVYIVDGNVIRKQSPVARTGGYIYDNGFVFIQWNNGNIVITVKDKKISGKYKLTVNKVDENSKYLNLGNGNFDIKLVEDLSESQLNGVIPSNKTRTDIIGGRDGNKVKSKDVSITKTGYDALIINEQQAPNGYSKYGKEIIIYVKKAISSGNYVADVVKAKVYIGGALQTMTETSNGLSYDDGNVVINFNNNAISVNVKNKKIDIALKKTITKVTDGQTNVEKAVTKANGFNVSRSYSESGITSSSINNKGIDVTKLKNGTSTNALYYMNKTPVEISIGDKVEYSIKVFNEGQVPAKAKEIADYIPVGLRVTGVKFKGNGQSVVDLTANTNSNKYYTYDEQNGVLKITNNDGACIPAFNTSSNDLSYDEYIVTCEVLPTATGVLTNVAEITRYTYSDGTQEIDTARDIDSVQDNWNTPNGDNHNPNTDKSTPAWRNYANNKNDLLDGEWHSEFIGQQNVKNSDDDDFDKLVVSGKYNLTIKKLVNNVETDDIRFNISRLKINGIDRDTFENVETANATIGYQETLRSTDNGEISYTIDEVENSQYIQLPGSLNLVLGIKNGKLDYYKLSCGSNYYGQFRNTQKTFVITNNGIDIEVKVTADFQNSDINIEINNKTIQNTPYSLKLKKVSSEDGSVLSGVTFTGTKQIGSQAEEGISLVTGSDGLTSAITTNVSYDDVNTDDVYRINEIDLGTNTGFTKLNEQIVVRVGKQIVNGKAVVKDYLISCGGRAIRLNKDNLSGDFDAYQGNVAYNISATVEEIDGNLTNLVLTVPNIPDQPLPLQIRKVSKNTGEQLTGAEIEVRNYLTNALLNTTVDNSGTISYTDHVGVNTTRVIYKITELNAPAKYDNILDGKYIKAIVRLTNGVPTSVDAMVYNNDDDLANNILSAEITGTINNGTVDIEIRDPKTVKVVDLALKKVIVAVNDKSVDASTGIYDRLTQADNKVKVDPTPLQNGETNAIYNLNKTPVKVSKGDIIKYQIRIYNEGSEIDATAGEIKDYIPYGLEFRNVYYRNSNDPLIRNLDYSFDSISNVLTINALRDKFIAKYDNGNSISYDYVTVECLVKDTAEGLQTNIAEITKYKTIDEDSIIEEVESDVDSQPANWRNPVNNNTADNARVNRANDKWREYAGKSGNVIGEGQFKNYVGQQDDDDFEKIFVGEIDLVLKKVITNIGETSVSDLDAQYQRFQNGKINVNTEFMNNNSSVTTAEYYMNKTPIKVNVNDIVTYQIRIYNEGSIDAVASEIKDYIPKGLTFNSVSYNGNVLTSGYSINNENVLTITALDGKLIEQYDGVEPKYDYVTVKCTVNGAVRGLLTNVAEISKYQTIWGYTNVDRDSQTTGDGEWVPNGTANKNTLDGKSGASWARYYETGTSGSFINYPLQQDDDDFEKIIVTNNYTLKIKKISNDSNEIMNGVQFKVNNTLYTTDAEGYITLPAYELSVESGLGGLDTFHIEEVATKENYAKLSIQKDAYTKGSDFYFFVDKMVNGDGSVSTNNVRINFKDSNPSLPNAYITNLPYGQVTLYTTDADGNAVPVNIKKTEGDDGNFEITITIGNNKRIFDLSLRKYIIKAGEKDIDRWGEPAIDISNLVDDDETTTTAVYNNAKDPVEVYVKDKVLYGIKVYNEGNFDGFAELVMDDVPEGVEMVAPEESEVNTLYGWKMYRRVGNNEAVDASEVINYNNVSYVRTYNASEATVIVTDFLSKANGEARMEQLPNAINPNLIRAFDASTMDEPDGREIRVEFKVKETAREGEIIINKAQITEDKDKDGNPVTDIDSTPNVWEETPRDDDQDIEKIVVIREREFDLSLRKFIAKVNGKELENSREPVVDCSKLVNRTSTTAKYTHSKEPVLVNPTDVVEYTIRVYNEGEIDGYANLVMDDIPEGVQMIAPDVTPDGTANNLNAEYRWVMYRKVRDGEDVSDKQTISYDGKVYVTADNAEEAEVIVTDYLSQANGPEANLLKAFDPAVGEMTEENYRDIKVEFRVKELVDAKKEAGKLITNYAQITDDSDNEGNPVIDRDSTPNEWENPPRDDDQDYDVVRVGYFDLALYKWVSKAIVTEGGKTTEYESGHTQGDKTNVVNVTIPKDKLDETVVKFSYQIKVENEGTIPGYAKELKDHIPEGLKFVKEDNTEFGWVEQEDGTITTDYLKDTLLNPGDTAEVTVVLTWINGSDNLGKKVNFAEISEDYNKYGWPDIDSTPNNFKETPKEDDEDEDEVLLQIRTGAKNIAIIVTIATAMAIVAGGAVCVKKFVVNK